MFYLFGSQLRARSDELFKLYRGGDLKLRIGGEFTLETAADAHAAMETGGSIGKLVIRPWATMPALPPDPLLHSRPNHEVIIQSIPILTASPIAPPR